MAQTTDTLLMVRPAVFGWNAETAANNYFQLQKEDTLLHQKALQQFDEMVSALEEKNINVWVMPDTVSPPKPDAVFPNNWFTCNNGCITLFPMHAENRRTERRPDIIELIKERTGISSLDDLTCNEQVDRFLEGSGSMCFDHVQKVIYACRSERTNEILLKGYADKNNYSAILFDSADRNGNPVYHTNVLMCIGESFVVICEEAIVSDKEKLLNSLKENRTLIPISMNQLHCFAGNMLEVKSREGNKYLLMSRTAFTSLTPYQLTLMAKFAEPLVFDVDVIESNGGSVRCMLAEIFY